MRRGWIIIILFKPNLLNSTCQQFSPLRARQGDNTIVWLYISLGKQTWWTHKHLLWAAKPKYDYNNLQITARQRTMAKVKAIRNTWDSKHKWKCELFSHRMQGFITTTATPTPFSPLYMQPHLFSSSFGLELEGLSPEFVGHQYTLENATTGTQKSYTEDTTYTEN